MSQDIPESLGPYRITHKLGEGGMGVVYAAEHMESGEPAAIKTLFGHMADREGFRERFELEIETLRKLRHPNIVRLFGYGEEGDVVFYAMEWVVGKNLEEMARGGKRFTWREVVDIALQCCEAFKHAHDRGVIHRDIKPANIMMQPDGVIKVSDFGIAKLYGQLNESLDSGVVGTANYMSPEQVQAGKITERSDLYCLGGVLYTLLAGRPPFVTTNLQEMLRMQTSATPDPVSRHVPGTPKELEAMIATLLEKDPKQRFPNARVLARALDMARKAIELHEQTLHKPDSDEPAVREVPTSEPPPSVPLSPLPEPDQPASASGQPPRSQAKPPASSPDGATMVSGDLPPLDTAHAGPAHPAAPVDRDQPTMHSGELPALGNTDANQAQPAGPRGANDADQPTMVSGDLPPLDTHHAGAGGPVTTPHPEPDQPTMHSGELPSLDATAAGQAGPAAPASPGPGDQPTMHSGELPPLDAATGSLDAAAQPDSAPSQIMHSGELPPLASTGELAAADLPDDTAQTLDHGSAGPDSIGGITVNPPAGSDLDQTMATSPMPSPAAAPPASESTPVSQAEAPQTPADIPYTEMPTMASGSPPPWLNQNPPSREPATAQSEARTEDLDATQPGGGSGAPHNQSPAAGPGLLPAQSDDDDISIDVDDDAQDTMVSGPIPGDTGRTPATGDAPTMASGVMPRPGSAALGPADQTVAGGSAPAAAPGLIAAPGTGEDTFTPNQPGTPEAPGLAGPGTVGGDPVNTSAAALSQRRFITAEEADRLDARREAAERQRTESGSPVMQLLVTAAFGLLVIGTVWWLLSPPSADRLYGRIEAYIQEDRLQAAEPSIESFVKRFPDDPRVEDLQPYLEQIELESLDRKLQTRAKLGLRGRGEILPVEQLYTRAIALAESDPDQGREQLQALIDLHRVPGEEVPEEVAPYLELAQKRLENLEQKINSRAAAHVQMLRQTLNKTKVASVRDPDQARRVCEAIIDLYGDKPWAANHVADARALLDRLAVRGRQAEGQAEKASEGQSDVEATPESPATQSAP